VLCEEIDCGGFGTHGRTDQCLKCQESSCQFGVVHTGLQARTELSLQLFRYGLTALVIVARGGRLLHDR
jgi:hypothetical protein